MWWSQYIYCLLSLQNYIQQKREERRKRAQQEQEGNLEAAKMREKKLKRLYETQRLKVENNLRQQQRQREAPTRIPPTSAAIHIHIHDTSETVSTHVHVRAPQTQHVIHD